MSEPKTNPKNNGEQSATGSFRFEKQILNTSSIGVLITRISDGTILYANKAIASLLGFAMGDSVIGRPVPDFYWDSADGQKMLDLFRTEGSVTSNEMRARQADGNMIWVSISLQPFQFEGEQSLLAEIVDVTERKQAENAVKASQQKLSLLIDSSPLAVIEWNTNFEVVSWNPAAERIFGYSFEEAKGRHAAGLIVPAEYKAAVDDVWANLLKQTGGTRSTNGNVTKDGHAITCEWYNTPLAGSDGKVFGVSSLVEDVTERTQAENAIKESQQKLSLLINSSPLAVIEWNTSFEVVSWNPAAERIFGYSFEEAKGRHAAGLIVPAEYKAVVDDVWANLLKQTGGTRSTNGNVTKDGRAITCEWYNTPLAGPDGKVFGVSSLVEDVTVSRQAEEKALQLQSAVEQTGDGIALADLNGNVLYANPAWAEIHGYTVDEIQGKHLSIFHTREQLEQEVIPFNNKVMEVGKYSSEIGHARKDGSTFPTLMTTVVQKDENGNAVGLIGTIRDITERKEALERLNESEARYQLLSEATIEGIVIHDKGILLDANQTFAKMFGYNQAEVIGTSALNFLTPDSREITSQNIRSGYEKPYDVTGLRKDGSTFPVEITGKAIPYQGLTVRVTALRDITERKQLEREVQEGFERRGYQVQVSTEISQEVAAAFELSDLFARVVTLTKERLGYYHTQLLRYDSSQDAVALVNGYGETGQKMLALGHKMPMGSGLIGTAAESGQTVLRPTLADDPDWKPNPLLPETKGEIAIPIKFGEQILGVLDVQSNQAGALTEDDRLLLEGLCGQIAIAMHNAELVETIRQNESRLAEAAAIAQLGYWEFDMHTDTYTFTDQFYALLRTTAEREGGYKMSSKEYIHKFMHPDDRYLVNSEIQKSIEITDADHIEQFENRFIRADGTEGYVTGRSRVIKDAQGRTVKTIGFNQDITERKQTEARLAEALRAARLANWEYDVEKDIFTFNDQFYAIFHTTAEKAGGYQLSSARYTELFVHPDDLEVVGTEIGKALSSTERVYNTTIDHRIVYEDGGIGYITVQLTVERDENGKITRYYGANQDITERKQTEEALRESERLMRTVIDSTPDWIFIKDQDHRYQLANKGYADALHIAPEDFIGKNDLDLGFPEELVKGNLEKGIRGFWSDDHLVMDSNETQIYPDDPATIDGTVHSFHTIKVPLRDVDGKAWGVLAFSRDITERKQAEETLRENEARLAEALKTARLANWEYDVEKDIFTFNDQFYSIFHTTVEKAGGYQLSSARYTELFVHPDDLEVVGTEIGKALSSTERVYNTTIDHRIVYEDGGIGYITVQLTVERDENGKITRYYGANQDITERKQTEEALRRSEQEMAERLEEINRLYQTMSREGWKTYRENEELPAGFVFDRTGTRPVEDELPADAQFANIPMRVLGGEVIGTLAVENDPNQPTSPEDYAFFQQVSDQIALALEGARLSAQTQTALAQSEILFEASRRLAQASNLQELLKAAIETFNIPVINGAELNMFNYDLEGDLESLAVVANWWNGTGKEPGAIGSRYSKAMFSAVKLFLTSTPVFISDTSNNENMDTSMQRIVKAFNIHAVTFLPLFVGTHQIGVLVMHAEEPHSFTEEETRLFAGLGPQIATVLDNRRQFERAQQQAERESMLNVISQKIQNATTVEAVLQIAARELGHALGAPMTVAQLSMKDKQ